MLYSPSSDFLFAEDAAHSGLCDGKMSGIRMQHERQFSFVFHVALRLRKTYALASFWSCVQLYLCMSAASDVNPSRK